MSLFRNVCRSSKCLINCRRTFITAHPLTGGGGARVCQTPQLLSHNVPSKIFIKRWRSGVTGRYDDKENNDDDDEDNFDVSSFFRDGEDEKDSLPLKKPNIQEEAENELFQGKIQGRQRVVDKKTPVGPAVIQELQKMFGMTHEEAFTTLYSTKFIPVADAAVLKSIYCLKDFEIPKEQIQRSPWILLEPADQLVKKIGMLADHYLFRNYSDGLGFCYFPTYKIKKYQKIFELERKNFPDHINRIYYMADRLMIPVDHLTERIVKSPKVLTMNLHRIEIFMNLLNKYEVHREDILNDLWIFFNNIDLAERRLKEVISAGCKRPKLWMCRCEEEVFDRTLSKYKTQKDALGDCRSLDEYLMKRLECSYEELLGQLDYDERLRKTNVGKIQKIIDLLLSEGFQPHQIRRYLRVFKYSEERIAMRIRRLKDLGVTDIPLSIIYMTPRAFENYCDNS